MKLLDPPILRLAKDDERYPWRLRKVLGDSTPKELFVRGNLRLLDEHAISFCGARDASPKGIDAATACAKSAVSEGYTITSGNARGVDRATHRAAFLNGGFTIVVLPEGIERFSIAPELRDVWDWDRTLVISQFDPKAIWRSYQAMNRNSVIMALSCAMVVVEAAESGGTRAAGEEALKLKIPLFAIDYGFDDETAPGNKVLIEKGARKLRRSKESGKPNLAPLIEKAQFYCSLLAESAAKGKSSQAMLL